MNVLAIVTSGRVVSALPPVTTASDRPSVRWRFARWRAEFAVTEITGKVSDPLPSRPETINLDRLCQKVPYAHPTGTGLDFGFRLVEFLLLKFEVLFPPAVALQHGTELGKLIIGDQVE
jgi:hypothetical protein